jgi:crotonobetainyl-CoA:carnitine CoA-transferase CaiB-like acyl-CoA transferase
MFLGDYGAEVIKVEHPATGDPQRQLGRRKNGVPLWWKQISRNKKSITLYLGSPEGQALLKKLVATADVVVENYRPGTMERWGLGWDVLHEITPRSGHAPGERVRPDRSVQAATGVWNAS